MHAKEQARQQGNQVYRQEQLTLQRDAREREAGVYTGGQHHGIAAGTHGLGRMEEGYGFFPTLATLQFQEAVPPPSRSITDDEQKIKEVLNKTLMMIGGIVFIVLLFC